MKHIKVLDPASLNGIDVLPISQLAQLTNSSNLIEETEEWIADQHASIEDLVRSERAEAYAEAYAEGLGGFLESVQQHKQALEALGGRLLEFVEKCLIKILGELPDEELLRAGIQQVLSNLAPNQDITFAVHPDRVPDMERVLADISESVASHLSAVVSADTSLDPSECLVFTDAEVFNISVQVMTDQMIDAVGKYLKGLENVDA